jgi:deoxycytidine triphosphate deaminase
MRLSRGSKTILIGCNEIHVTAPKIDPGFEGSITLEMFNFSQAKVTLSAIQGHACTLDAF